MITNDLLHALRYLQMVNDAGAGVPAAHLDAWLNVTPPAELSRLDALTRQFEQLIGRDHGYAEYIELVGWADGDPMRITATGRAVVKAHEGNEGVQDEALVILSPQNPMNLVTLTSTIAKAQAGMLVDPYFKDDLFQWLMESTSIRRVLVCREPADRSVLPMIAGAASLISRDLEIRCLPLRAVHDRFLVTQDGAIFTIGSSLNGLQRHFTTITRLPDPGTDTVREYLEKQWDAADPVVPKTTLSSPQQAD
ncbi:hypothetical protein [Cellulomonas endometrii]|uniref:hypothetical protein n=1 Tax=Cellulomonas endometrii TaxID=3036301 RepID=UPI0024AE48D8|nr:hypothetical protein [Cellulomonas endometrii]